MAEDSIIHYLRLIAFTPIVWNKRFMSHSEQHLLSNKKKRNKKAELAKDRVSMETVLLKWYSKLINLLQDNMVAKSTMTSLSAILWIKVG